MRVLARYRAAVPTPVTIEAAGLSPREFDVLRLLAHGRTNAEIGETLHISHRTARCHVSSILLKLGVRYRGEAAARAHTFRLS